MVMPFVTAFSTCPLWKQLCISLFIENISRMHEASTRVLISISFVQRNMKRHFSIPQLISISAGHPHILERFTKDPWNSVPKNTWKCSHNIGAMMGNSLRGQANEQRTNLGLSGYHEGNSTKLREALPGDFLFWGRQCLLLEGILFRLSNSTYPIIHSPPKPHNVFIDLGLPIQSLPLHLKPCHPPKVKQVRFMKILKVNTKY